MFKPYVIFSSSAYSESELNTKAVSIISSLTGNAHFPTSSTLLATLLATLSVAQVEYSTALGDAQTKDVNKKAIKDHKKEILIGLLLQLKDLINAVANGNQEMLVSSGFDIAKDGSGTSLLGEVHNFQVSDGGMVGEILSKCDGVENVVSYLHEYVADPITADSIWTSKPSTNRSFTHKNLPSLKKYWFRITAVGRNDQTSISPLLSRAAQ